MLTDRVFYLFMEVIDAARNSRFHHGNGAQWCITSVFGEDVVIDTVQQTWVKVKTPNPIAAHADNDVADRLHSFLMHSDMQESYTYTWTNHSYRVAIAALVESCKNGEVLFTNGGQFFVNPKSFPTKVFVYDISVANQVAITYMSDGQSWKYMNSNGVRPIEVGQSTIDHLRRL